MNTRLRGLVVVGVAVIAGCHGAPKRPPPDQVTAGSTLTVTRAFTIPAGQTGVYFQDNALRGSADPGSVLPYCHFRLPGSAAKPRTVAAETFTVTNIEFDEDAAGQGSGFASITRLNLQGGKQAGEPRVSCLLPGTAATRRFITPAEIRGAMGAYIDLKVAQ